MSCLKLGSIKVPQFDRVNYYLWKKKMTLFIEVANPLYMGSILENGPFVPMKMIPESTVDGVRVPQRPTPKDPAEFTDSEKEIVAMDTWLQLIIFDSMDTDMCYQILNCTSGKQMWDTIVLIMEGTEEVKENRLDILTSRYEAFKSLPGETITQVFERYNRLLNELRIQGKNYPLRETNRKFMRTLPHHVEHKVSSIRERDNLNTMPLEKLYGKLKTYEMEHHELGHLATECKEPKQAKDKNVFYEKKSYEELKRENEKLKRRLDPLVAKQQGKAYTAEGKSWDDTDSEEEEEEYRNLALMADSSEASPSSQLLDSGNLVIRDETDGDPDNYLWQSFDMPGNTLLPGAKLGWNLETGLERYLNSWKSDDDPSLGEYTNRIDRDGFPQLVVKKGSAIQSRGGFWNGVSFSGTPNLKPNPIYKYDFLSNGKELYYRYEVVNASIVTRRILNPLGYIQRWIWNEKSQTWQLYHSGAKDDCERYAVCGAYGSCNVNGSPTCECLDGFEPKSQKEWDAADWSSGCVRKVQLSCADGEGFVKHSELILPDTQRSWFDKNMSLDECNTSRYYRILNSHFLSHMDVSCRQDRLQPVINKPNSACDKNQKSAGMYYLND